MVDATGGASDGNDQTKSSATLPMLRSSNTRRALSFTVTVPANLTPGAHTLVLTSGTGEVRLPVTVLADGSLAATGGTFPIGFVTVLAAILLAAGLVLVARRRSGRASV